MDRIRKPSKGGSIDQLAFVKAAAWAWYERGSGQEHRSTPEYDLSMPRKPDPKPSRYKLEAASPAAAAVTKEIPPLSPQSSASNSEINSLLDEYEVERISKQLDLYIESSRARSSVHDHHYAHNNSNNKVASLSEDGTSEGKSKAIKKSREVRANRTPFTFTSIVSRGFWSKYAALCGSRREDVVDGRSFKIRHVGGGGGGGSRKRI